VVADRVHQPRIASLYRYPVKGMSAEPLEKLILTPGEGVPGDRILAFSRPDTAFDEEHPEPLPKTRFFMLQKDETLARIRSEYDPLSGCLKLIAANGRVAAEIGTVEGQRKLEDFLAGQLHMGDLHGRPRLVRAYRTHRFTDAGISGPTMMQAISMINLASVRDLEEKIGTTVDPLRFRANIYIDGVAPWAELDWTGQDITLGSVAASVLARTPRCAATTVNPSTGERDIRILKELAANYGHTNCGIYVSVLSSGTVHLGEPLGHPSVSEKG
jgi:uncharacterized protein